MSLPKAPFFPFSAAPAPGETITVASGVHWFCTTLPHRLGTVNHWLIRDSSGWTMVDAGFPTPTAQAQIEATWSAVLDDLPITRLVITHHHPDHAGNARWICDRWGIEPSITPTAYREAQLLLGVEWEKPAKERLGVWQRYGLPADVADDIITTWHQGREHFAALPAEWQPLKDGQVLRIGDQDWQVIVAYGHAPEQALLHCPALQVLVAGDQILPGISPNVSEFTVQPEAAPLAAFLSSNDRIAQSCGDVLVLPSHGLPFRGLHTRIEELKIHHEQRLQIIEDALRSPSNSEYKTAADLLPSVFARQLWGLDAALGLGETIAHLHHLVALGRARRIEQNGLIRFAALPARQ